MKVSDIQAFSQIEKLQYIEYLAFFDGTVMREDIINRFGISKASATNLLATYNQIMPDNLRYDVRRKCYVISNEFKPTFNMGLLIERIPVYTIPKFENYNNQVDMDWIERIALISRAIQRTRSLKITYTSISSGKSTRQIIPVAFADNLLRWHLRAYDRKRKQFIDFVLARINKVKPIKNDYIKPHELPENDRMWYTFVDLKIKPHPHNLADLKSFKILSQEYNNVRLRAAMAGYFLKLWGVDCSPDASLRGAEFQYILENLTEISEVADLKFAPGFS